MKKIPLLLALLPSLAISAGPYDGIYLWPREDGDLYLSVHQSDAGMQVLVTFLEPEYEDWGALKGELSGNSVALSPLDERDFEWDAVRDLLGESAIFEGTAISLQFSNDGVAILNLTREGRAPISYNISKVF